MIEKVILDYLSANLTVPVYMEEPETNPNPTFEPHKFIVIEKTGSSLENHIYTAMIAIQSYAGTLYEAAVLNEQVKQLMLNAIVLNQITRVDLNSDYNSTDESTKRPRYQAVFDITHYA